MTITPLPVVAPCDSCIACLHGDTITGFTLDGEAEFHIGVLMALDIPEDQAIADVKLTAHQYYGCDYGWFPTFDMRNSYRVCSTCAAKTSLTVAELTGGAVPLYRQSDLGV